MVWSRRRFLSLGSAGASALTLRVPIAAPEEQSPSQGERPLAQAAAERQAQRLRLMRVGLGQAPADVVIVNGTLLNTLTGELLPDGAWRSRRPHCRRSVMLGVTLGPRRRVDATGMTLVPASSTPTTTARAAG